MSRIQDLPDDDKPREKLARLGASSLDNAELLALFIGSGSKDKNAIEVGQEILKHFGSLNSLGGAGLDELLTCPGIGPAKGSLLAAAFELGARAAREQVSQTPLDSPERIHESFAPQLAWLGQERLLIAMVDSRLRHTGTIEISSGTLNETSAHPREVLRPVMLRNAYGFVLIHNHPSGDPAPSEADRQFTRRLAEAADILQLRFVDHVIIGRPDKGRDPYFSFREAGLF
ncbi:RadC family protein [Haloferula sp.]|uniref:RadC family protein n=1 Tax=Haloferula sp. TaxID=2497595 RepID=UPI00329E7812